MAKVQFPCTSKSKSTCPFFFFFFYNINLFYGLVGVVTTHHKELLAINQDLENIERTRLIQTVRVEDIEQRIKNLQEQIDDRFRINDDRYQDILHRLDELEIPSTCPKTMDDELKAIVDK